MREHAAGPPFEEYLLPHRAHLRTGDAQRAVTAVKVTQALTHTEPVSTGPHDKPRLFAAEGPCAAQRIALFA